ncbi:unnamed protein product [Spirodela intermedia]|uniref:Uncharacterized protein n=1 Tax=Spirodela intermedia TaxID=51605 RepID=A0A7I8K9B5_SPIIN|nr:unnamed protein product [Spirodela intermedia]
MKPFFSLSHQNR